MTAALCSIIALLLGSLAALCAKHRKLLRETERGRSRMYDKLRDSEEDKARLKRQLTQNIAHELKTPVSSIRGYLETIVSTPEMDEETKRQFIQRTYAQSKRLSSLLGDISILNRLDDAPQGYEFETIKISELLKSIRRDVSQQLEDKRAEFRILLEQKITVRGNQSLLYSVFRNLTDNSIAYGGDGVIIIVQVVEEGDRRITFSFSDNGPGEAPEHLPHLFERFYRVDKGRSRKSGGTGLGLAIVKNAVLLHDGSICVRKGRYGGLEFIFDLPKAGPS